MQNEGNFGSALLLGTLAGAVLGLAAGVVSRSRWMDVRGRRVLITGGSRGLGLVLARELAARGARVAICARDNNELTAAAAEFHAAGREVFAVGCDLLDRREARRLVPFVEDEFGPIDILINNAGTIEVGPIDATTWQDYEDCMHLHFWAALELSAAVIGSMRRRGGGRIVNIASFGGRVAVPHLLPYCASKFALVGLSQGMRSELAKDRIYVTTVCPGMLRTGSYLQAEFKGNHRAEFTWFALGAGAPLLSMSAQAAARRIVEALQVGEAHLTLGLPARIAEALAGIAPNTTAAVLEVADRILPAMVEEFGCRARHKGYDSQTSLTRSPLTILSQKAAERNNEWLGSV